ncbi:DUF2249 domain-containing protein [Cohnella fermenti]|uniref:DUF2249 domain-containing protein n=1 Tax=Cohnella fermenti TaxID=2565925 RepID=A0A4V3WEE9_9BACL|nr:DUF2249 domain-containing protein [Cohnella fermenti]THF76060.1 DUF2249 domain-containing protein [Cohnella fermenti]
MERSEARIVELDVRPCLSKKIEPFQLIMETVKKLDVDDIFVLHAPFKPTPLFGVLKMKGLSGHAEQREKDHWVSTFVHKRNKGWLQNPSADEEKIGEAEARSSDRPSAEGREPAIVRLDNRGLEPPKPMIRTLAALERCYPGDRVVIHNDRVPMFLIEELHQLGYPYEVEEQADGSAKVTIHRT